jgi:hypothetical protein
MPVLGTLKPLGKIRQRTLHGRLSDAGRIDGSAARLRRTQIGDPGACTGSSVSQALSILRPRLPPVRHGQREGKQVCRRFVRPGFEGTILGVADPNHKRRSALPTGVEPADRLSNVSYAQMQAPALSTGGLISPKTPGTDA